MTAPLLNVQSLRKYFPLRKGLFGRAAGHVRAVDDVSFSLARQETLGLVGESGCGKSTAGKALLKLLTPDSGRVELDGEDILPLERDRMKSIRRRMQIVFQDPYSAINPRMSAGAYVGEPLLIHGLAAGADYRARVADLFHKVGLRDDQINRYPHEFSGGQRQRLAIARALSLNPDIIIADEAVSALDVSIQAAILNLLKDLQDELGLAYLFISHDIGVVEHISDKVAVMYLGKIVELAPRDALFNTPLHPYTEALLAAVPAANPRARRQRQVLSGEIPSPINPPSGCRFHTRCPLAQPLCSEQAPDYRQAAPGHWVACHLRPAPA